MSRYFAAERQRGLTFVHNLNRRKLKENAKKDGIKPSFLVKIKIYVSNKWLPKK